MEFQKRRDVEEEKERIRVRYRDTNRDHIDLIPATPTMRFHEDKRDKLVAVYARVSTGDPRQTSSYELQKNYYTETIDRHPGWKLVGIYADVCSSYGQIPNRRYMWPKNELPNTCAIANDRIKLSMYAKEMTTLDIEGHICCQYASDILPASGRINTV